MSRSEVEGDGEELEGVERYDYLLGRLGGVRSRFWRCVVVASVLVLVLSAPVAAANTATGSSSDDYTGAEAPAVSREMSVSGGEVRFDGEGVFEDFEGALPSYASPDYSIVPAPAGMQGSQAIQVPTGGSVNTKEFWADFGRGLNNSEAVTVQVLAESTTDFRFLTLSDGSAPDVSGDWGPTVRFNTVGEIEYRDGSNNEFFVADYSANTVYNITFSDIDTSDYTYDLTVRDGSTGAVLGAVDDVEFWHDIDTVRYGEDWLQSDGGYDGLIIDYVRLHQEGLYVSAEHQVTAATSGYVDISQVSGAELNASISSYSDEVQYFPLEEGSGDTAHDFDNPSETAEIVGPGVEWVPGLDGAYALNFDASGGRVYLGETGDGNSMTVSVKAKMDAEYGGSSINGVAGEGARWRVYFDKSTGTIKGRFKDGGGGNNYLNGPSYQVGEEYHIVMLRNSSAARHELWVNGSLFDSTNKSMSINSGSDNGVIGEAYSGSGQRFNGTIDEFRLWNKGLTSSEIADVFNYSSPSTRQTTAGNYSLSLSNVPGWFTNHRVTLHTSPTSLGTISTYLDAEGIKFLNHDPQMANFFPSGGFVDAESVSLNVSLSDEELGAAQGESVEVTFRDAADNSVIGTDTVTAEGVASVTWGDLLGGPNTWFVEGVDSWGGSAVSGNYTFTVPANLSIRDEAEPNRLINDTTVKLIWNPSNGSLSAAPESDLNTVQKSTSNGVLDMVGLPVAEEYLVELRAEGYYSRTALVKSVTEQDNLYMLSSSGNVTVRENVFTLNDPGHQFDLDETIFYLERPMEINGSNSNEVVLGNYFQATNQVPAVLEYGVRYRIVLEDSSGSFSRQGSYTPLYDGEVPVSVRYSWEPPERGLYRTNISVSNVSSGGVLKGELAMGWVGNASALEITVYERGNSTNVVFTDSVGGELTSYATSTTLVGAENYSTDWVVRFNATVGGESVSVRRPVSFVSKRESGIPLPAGWALFFGVGIVLVFAFAFGGGARMAPIGSLLTGLMGAVMWYVGWLPSSVATATAVVLSILIGVLSVLAAKDKEVLHG